MTRLAPLWQQNGSYPAATDRVLINTLWPSAAVSGGASSLQANTMNVVVAAGTAAVPLTSGNYSALCRWDAAETVTLTAAPPAGNSRIDLIVLQVRDAVLDAGSNNDFLFQAVAGTPTTGTPAAPAVPNNAMAVAQVLVPGGAANLNGATLTDRRLPLNLRDKVVASAYRNAAFTLPASAPAQIPIDVVLFDPAGMYRAGGSFVVPVAGIYLCSVFLTAGSSAANSVTACLLQKNGATQMQFNAYVGGAGGFPTPGGPLAVQCAAGDTMTMAGFATNAVAMNVGAGQNFLMVSYLGTG